jgi:TonB family protein
MIAVHLQRKQLLALVLGMGLLVLLLLLSSLTVMRDKPGKPPVVLENVQLYVPPKPPPEAESTKLNTRAGASGSLQVRIPQPQQEMGLMKLDTARTAAVAVPAGYGLNGVRNAGFGEGGTGDLDAGKLFSFNQLDSTPAVLSVPPIAYPDSFIRRGIHEFRVVFHIIVDEDGRVQPVRVLESPDASLNAMFLEYAAHTTFTPPVREGKRVRAQYSWPVLFTLRPNAKR